MITRKEIADGLRELGLREGDVVFLHSSLSSLGHVEGGAEALVAAFLDVLGSQGTLVVPTFEYVGVVPETVKNDPRAVTSVHPMACVAAIGASAEQICRDHWKAKLAHGPGTPYTRIAEMGGYVCLLGVDQDRSTTLHAPEELLALPYLERTAEKTFSTPEGEITRSWASFPGPHRDFIGLDRMFRESGKMRIGRIGSSVVRLMKSSDLIDLATEAGRNDPAFVLCDNPNCADCVKQRAALRRYRFAGEDFKPAASASLAGRYVPEMIENLHAAGIELIELDAIQGRPVGAIASDRLSAAVDELRKAGIEISALRTRAIRDDNSDLFDKAVRCKVTRVVLPVSHRADRVVAEAAAKKLSVSFVNTDMDSRGVFEVLSRLKEVQERGRNVAANTAATAPSGGTRPAHLVFSAAAFARVGEKPFLQSYQNKLGRFTDQLDVADATFAGVPQPLGCGNAEIKEMISILRSSGFSGYMVLSAENRVVGDLSEAVSGLEWILDTI